MEIKPSVHRQFGALSAVPRQELGITTLLAQGAHCLCNSSRRTHPECYLSLFPGFIKVKTSAYFLRLVKTGTNIGLL